MRTHTAEASPALAAAADMTTAELIAHLVETYHDRLRETLPALESLAARAMRTGGAYRGQLRAVEQVLADLVDATLPHLDEDEHHVFPVLVGARPPPVGFGRVLAAMAEEGHIVDALVQKLLRATDGFHSPPDATPEHAQLVVGLAELARQLQAHVQLEQEVLLPRYNVAILR